MSLSSALAARSGNQCELCNATQNLTEFDVPESAGHPESTIVVCGECDGQINGTTPMDDKHWRCLSDSMWSQVPAVQVMAWRTLKKLSGEAWAQDLLDMLYLDDDLLQWAEAGAPVEGEDIVHIDSNGAILQAGDTVTIIKDLTVKGTSFVAKRGTAVRGISLTDNPEHIEGRVNGTRIVILTCYVKKS
ncbi:PhnA domain-containing protein [Alteromonadaceae bacterium BrNp21-10]|nr:PhnA domain-containing protein [Alteromonadaceae bacterium BrNp21-10]